MGLLQDPIAALDQVDWYLKNGKLERFPGAFELAAGNLCRQTLEQVLFILCFFSGMPHARFIRMKDRSLHVAGKLVNQLGHVDPDARKSYWELARKRGPRIRKFASQPRTLKKWQRILNEPSHFTLKFRAVDASTLGSFVHLARAWFDEKDKYLLVGAVNEIFSKGRVVATLGNDTGNTPGICQRVVVTANNLERTSGGGLALRGPEKPLFVISSTNVPRGRWPQVPVVVQHSVGISLGFQFVTKRGKPLDISSMEGVLGSLASTKGERSYLSRRLRELGLEIRFQRRTCGG